MGAENLPQLPTGKLIAETTRLCLRQLTPADLPVLVELFGTLEVMRFSLTGPLAPQQVAEILKTILASYQVSSLSLWGVIEKSDGQLIGLSGFMPGVRQASEEWELAYRFLPCWWGRGLATEAAAACIDMAWQDPQVATVSVWIEQANQASLRVAQKLGFQVATETVRHGLPAIQYVLHRPVNR